MDIEFVLAKCKDWKKNLDSTKGILTEVEFNYLKGKEFGHLKDTYFNEESFPNPIIGQPVNHKFIPYTPSVSGRALNCGITGKGFDRHHIPEFNVAQRFVENNQWDKLKWYLENVRILLCPPTAHKSIHNLIKTRKIDESDIGEVLKICKEVVGEIEWYSKDKPKGFK